jgi:uncharacterized damage-inducible protein DinB
MASAGWTAPAVERRDPPRTSGERAALEGWLDYHRATLLTKCAGLTEDQLRQRSTPPSNLSLLGLVRHMAEVERWWFRINVGAEPVTDIYCSEQSPDADFDDVDTADAEADLATFQAEVELARRAAAGRELDETFERPHGPLDVRWAFIHMIEEYARHNGHADLLRERIDGVTGE